MKLSKILLLPCKNQCRVDTSNYESNFHLLHYYYHPFGVSYSLFPSILYTLYFYSKPKIHEGSKIWWHFGRQCRKHTQS